MILYKGGRISFVQYMPQKPTKRGLKVFALCTSYLFNYEEFTGELDGDSAVELLKCLLRRACW